MVGLGCGLELKILTFYVRIWCCCLKLWFRVENLDALCLGFGGVALKLKFLTFYVGFGGVV